MDFKGFWPDKNIVHKGNDDDVLIYNARRGLPRIIKKEIFEEKILKTVPPEDIEILTKYYKNTIFSFEKDSDYQEGDYILCSIPPEISDREFEEKIQRLKKRDQTFLLSYYTKKDNTYILNTHYVIENDETKIIALLEQKDFKIDDYDRTKLSRILEPVEEIEFPPHCYCNMFNDTKHFYFYRKDHEHVPGIMLFEVARQACYVYVYSYKGLKRGKITISLAKADMEFYNYAQSNYPVRIMIEDLTENENTLSETGVLRLGLKVTMFQAFKKVGFFRFYGPAIKLDVFKTVRTEGISKNNFRFIPMKNFDKDALIISKSGKKYDCSIQNISAKGLNVCYNKKIEDIDQEFTVIIFVHKIGLIQGECKIMWQQQSDDEYKIGIELTNMSENDNYKLKEAIKFYTYLIEDREVL